MAKTPIGLEPVVGSLTSSKKREYRVTNRLQEGKRPLYAVVFNFIDSRYFNVFATIGGNRVTIYQCLEGDQKDESFYTVSWACSVDGAPFVVAGDINGIIRVIDASNEKIHKSFVGHGDSINEIRTQPLKPSLIVTASKDESIRLWNGHTGICILIFAGAGGHRNEVLSVDFHPSDIYRIASCGMDNTIKIWSMKDVNKLSDVMIARRSSGLMLRNHSCDRYSFKIPNKICTIPLFLASIHSNYVDCNRWHGDFILSKMSYFKCYFKVVVVTGKMSEKGRERYRELVTGRSSSDKEWTVFVDNLSKRVTRRELREIFNIYGRVLRVFIPSFMVKPNYKSSTFAFVQYAMEEGCRRAIQNVNGTLIDGKRVSVGVAKYKKERRRAIDDKSSKWKEVVNVEERAEHDRAGIKGGQNLKANGLRNVWEMHIPSEDSSWVKNSLTGVLKYPLQSDMVKKALAKEGYEVKIVSWGYVRNAYIVIFSSNEDFLKAWSNIREKLFLWFKWLSPLLNEGVPLAYCLVELVGLPFLSWSVPFLEKLARRWGEHVSIMEETKNRDDLSSARLLLRCNKFQAGTRDELLKYSVDGSSDDYSKEDEGVSSEKEEDKWEKLAEEVWSKVDTWLQQGQESGRDYAGLGLRKEVDQLHSAQSDSNGESSSPVSKLIPAGTAKRIMRKARVVNLLIVFMHVCQLGVHPVVGEKERLIRTKDRRQMKADIFSRVLQNIGELDRKGYHCSIDVQKTSNVPLICSNHSESLAAASYTASRTRFNERRKRRTLISEALEMVNISTASSSHFSKLLEEAMATWEVCQMLGRREKSLAVARQVKKFKPAMIFIQESKLDQCHASIIRRIGGNLLKGVMVSPAQGSKGGLIICMGGDFNVYLVPEVKQGRSQNWHAIETLRSFVQEANLMDLPMLGGTFTWCSNRELPTWVRLDRFLICGRFLNSFPRISQCFLPKSISDHNSVLLEDVSHNWAPEPFRFFNFMLEEKRFDDLVEGCVVDEKKKRNRGGIFRLLQNAKKMIRNWHGSSHLGADSISLLEVKINDLEGGMLSTGEWDQLIELKNELWRLLRIEESIWWQNSRNRWIINGDKNTRFFHLSAMKRNSVNTIHSLKIEGVVISEPVKIKNSVYEFFRTAYNTKAALEVEGLEFDFMKISAAQRAYMEEEFTEQEVWNAISSSDSAKAPGPDGFTMGFYKKYCKHLKEHIMEFFSNFFEGKEWVHRVNHAFITLIPKKGNPEIIEDYRPISLVGSLYKILSKVLSKRLISCVKDIISPNQFVFIPGRQLLECACVANEGIDSWRKQGLKGVVFKVDFSRAYDTVEWQIVIRLMKEMGFGDRWCSWITQCISTTSISVLLNGYPTEEFLNDKGLRQGCSLSPILFNVVGELLHKMLTKVVDLGLLQGLAFPLDLPSLLSSWSDLRPTSVIWKFIPGGSLIGDPSLADSISASKELLRPVCWWIPPPVDFFKLNVDGAFSRVGRVAGIGGLLRDWNRVTLISFSENVGPSHPYLAELKAIKRDIDIFVSLEWLLKGRLIIESDCKLVVDWIKDQALVPVFLSNFVKEIVSIVSFRNFIVRWIPRSCNCEAGKLAKEGIG
ncbi:Polycomb group protein FERTILIZATION-INDEPENDENT ENDOSPERM [Hibiscus syriacus]|uniref:Polycomb group protein FERTILIZATION-INDEPENDENT ENDOSPERM n=1 Tax=Hibiscus syriacus TaxID=106335 RepID=A0A6A2ZNH0_HIBSY|nr:Polycomb group protein FERTILIZATION-INDEPENDENT ENDOSPERM [Hibiscus syriacus]